MQGKCIRCGNNYDKCFQILKNGQTYTYDSFECAISDLAPECERCRCRIIGHGVENSGQFFCCVHCAALSNIKGLKDRI